MITTDDFIYFFSVTCISEDKVKENAEGKHWRSKSGSVENQT